MQETLLPFVQKANGILADYILIVLLVGVGLFFTIKTKFVQVRCFGEGMKRVFGGIKLFGGKNAGGGLSSFQALATAIAAQVGTGNIVGASGAILVGGPGAIFWMWIIAFLGMATIYAEATLAQETRVVDNNGEVHGGPAYYMKKAFPNGFGTFLSVFFAIALTLALGFMGSMVQSNSIAESLCNAVGVAYTDWGWIIGAVLAVVCAFIFLGGIQRIASVAEKIVPLMACLFLAGGLIVLITNFTRVPETFVMIFKYAFTPNALIGGGIGYALKTAISQGAKRGLFSNEAGMGSTPHAHAQANVEKPHDQGVAAMIGVFIDTFIVLTMTALVVITMLYTQGGPLAGADGNTYAAMVAEAGISKTNAMQWAVTNGFPSFMSGIGNMFVAICLTFFAFTTIIGWNFFGKINVQYLFKNNKVATAVYSVIAIVFIFLGSLLSNDLVWELTDFFNYLMVIPNAIALVALYKIVVKHSKSNKK
ncbi:MAG: sodium:alanine symporter family protein [Clostridia bacterium]|nr:sodium:alanine symporter family protein [Clostridia bacterium]